MRCMPSMTRPSWPRLNRMRDVDFVDQPGVRDDLADRRDLARLVARSYVA